MQPSYLSKTIQLLKTHFANNKALIIAILVSLLIHALSLSQFLFKLPTSSQESHILKVRLVKLQPVQKDTFKSVKEILPEAKKILAPATAAEPALLSQEIQPAEPHPAELQPAELQPAEPADQLSDDLPAVAIEETADDIDNNDLDNNDLSINPVSLPYQTVETELEIKHGDIVKGKTRITFRIDKNRTYTLASISEIKAEIKAEIQAADSTITEVIQQKSEGVITNKGLTPSYYSHQQTTYQNDNQRFNQISSQASNQNTMQSARFAWSDNLLLLQNNKGDIIEKLVADTQDNLSFMYQFMFSPTLIDTQLYTTDGQFFGITTFNIQNNETISTQLGELKTVHGLISNEVEKIEIWLSVDYQYLPVKIRKVDISGVVIEQTVTAIFTTPTQ